MEYLAKISEALRSLGLLHSDIEKIGGQIEAATSEYKANNDKEQSAPVVNAVLHRPQTEIDNDEARATRHETRDTNRLRLETLAVVVGGVVAMATLGQLILTKRAVSIAAQSADAAQRSAQASESAVQATKQSIQSQIDNFHLEQRAWLVTGGHMGPIDINHPIPEDTQINAINYGRTFAFRVTSSSRLQFYPVKQLKLEAIKEIPKELSIMAPNLIYKTGFTDDPLSKLPLRDAHPGINGNWYAYMWGEISYWDIFKIHHHTRFCGFRKVSASGEFLQCDIPGSNDAD